MTYQPPKDGVHRDHYPDGQLKSQFTFKNGELSGIARAWHENGQLVEEKLYRNGILHGICRQWNGKGQLLGASRFKNGTGMDRRWRENGHIASEFSHVRGKLCGRARFWESDGMFLAQMFYFDDKRISKKRYDEKCRKDPSLPRFEDKKPTDSVGNYIRRWRRERRQQAKLGPTPEELQYLRWFDEQRKAEIRRKDSCQATAWLKKNTRGERELGEMTRQEASRLLCKLYSAGAMNIWVTDIERDGDGSEYSRKLVIALPKEQLKRDKIYKLCIDPAQPADSGPAIFTGLDCMSVSLL